MKVTMSKKETSRKTVINSSSAKAKNSVTANKNGTITFHGPMAESLVRAERVTGVDASQIINECLKREMAEKLRSKYELVTSAALLKPWGGIKLNQKQTQAVLIHELRPIVEWRFKSSKYIWALCFGKGDMLFGLTDAQAKQLSIKESVSFHRLVEEMDDVSGGGNNTELYIRWLKMIERKLKGESGR